MLKGVWMLMRKWQFSTNICCPPFQMLLERTFGVTRLHEVDENLTELPELDNPESERLRTFVNWLNSTKPYQAAIKVIRY